MGLIVLFLLVGIVVAEIVTFVQVGGQIGAWGTAGLTILTAVIGLALVRVQGLGVLRRVQAAAERNEAPVREVFDGACLLVAGACLLVPGFVTDTLGLLLLLPPVRLGLLALLARRAAHGGQGLFVHVRRGNPPPPPHPSDPFSSPGRGGRVPGTVVDGEYREVPAQENTEEDHSNDNQPGKSSG